MHDESPVGTHRADRRDFLKKAGAVVWVVPTMQMLNVTSAAAGTTNVSVVTTTEPPVDDRGIGDAG